MNTYDVIRNVDDGKWELIERAAGVGHERVVFRHASQTVVHGHLALIIAPTAAPADLPPHHAALARVEAMQNELIALHVNVWGAYEVPRYGIDARVRHIPTGKLCVVRGYMAWTPPIVLYSLTEVAGPQLPEITPLSDIEAVTAHSGGSVS